MNWFGIRERAQRADRQTGSVIVPAAAALLVGLVLLGAAQLGQNFYVKRELQNAADLAALAGAQSLGAGDTLGCQEAKRMAGVSLRSQEGSPAAGLTGDSVQVRCGQWDGSLENTEARFTENLPARAVQVRLSYEAPSLFPFLSPASLDAVATANTSEPTATFSISSQLLGLNKGLLKLILKPILGDVDLSVLNHAGVAGITVTPGGLLKELGLEPSAILDVGTPNEALELKELKVGRLLEAALSAVDRSGTAAVDLGLLDGFLRPIIGVGALDIPLQLFGESGVVVIADGVSPLTALNTKISVIDLVVSSLVVANKDNFLDLSVGAARPLLGLDVRVRVVEPPSIQMGPVGTKANFAGIRVYANLETKGSLIGGLAGILGLSIDLPMIIELSQAEAELVGICSAGDMPKKSAEFIVKSSVANICLGTFPKHETGRPENVEEGFFSTKNSCKDMDGNNVAAPRGILKVLGFPVRYSVTAQVFPGFNNQEIKLYAPPDQPNEKLSIGQDRIDLNELSKVLVNDVVGGLVDSVLSGIVGGYNNGRPADWNNYNPKKLAEDLVGTSGAGKSITEVNYGLKWSAEEMKRLEGQMTSGLGGFLSGLLGGVANTLNLILLDPLKDVTCGLLLVNDSIRKCRVWYVEGSLQPGSSTLLSAILRPVFELLYPVFDVLSLTLMRILDLLGIELVTSDLKLYDVQCGTPYLVQ